MAVGLRRPTPYGTPPPFFTEDDYAQQPAGQYTGLPAGVGGVGVEQPQWPVLGDEQGDGHQLITPLTPTGGTQTPTQEAQAGDYPSEASIERRLRLAKALMGQQQEVNHPTQAIGNAVNQIAGAYMENKAGKDQESIEKRRRDAYKKALSGDGDLNAKADLMMASDDPAVVEKGLELKLQIAMAQGKKSHQAPTVRRFLDDEREVDKQWNEETGQWEEVGGGPRYKPGSGGADGGGKRQQGGAFQLPSGDVVAANFNPGDGQYYFQDASGKMVPVPQGSRPVTASTGGALTANQWTKLKKDRAEGINSLQAIDDYSKQAGSLKSGYQRWANDWTAKWKTFLGQQGLSQQQFDQLSAQAKQQALLGMLRTTIVGPGVMTEYDALRIIQAMGGDPSSALQNPEVLAGLLETLYERKRREVQVLDEEYRRNAPTFGEEPQPLPVPESIRGPQRRDDGQPQQSRLPQGVPPKDKRPKGTTVTKGGKTFEWTGTGWRERAA